MNAGVWSWRRPLQALTRLLLPPRCLHCGAPGADSRDLCADCRDSLPHNPCACPRCALPIAQPAPACGRCLKRPPPASAALAPFVYDDPLDRWLPRFKFARDLAAGRVLADLLLEDPRLPALTAGVDALVPLPLHRARLAERGYNQALELARPLARAFDLPLRQDWLQRVRATAPQTGLDARARRRNLRAAFVASAAMRGQRVLLIDDVITTGSSMLEATRACRRAGAIEVRVLAVARAPLGGRR
ncbi:MAG: ComF family protein [Lysobacterales bacterium]